MSGFIATVRIGIGIRCSGQEVTGNSPRECGLSYSIRTGKHPGVVDTLRANCSHERALDAFMTDQLPSTTWVGNASDTV